MTGFFERQRMRIAVLQPAAREQHVALDQRVDDGLVGIALLAVVVDDARRAALRSGPKPGASLVKKPASSTVKGMAVSMPRAAQLRRGVHPGVKVLAAMAGRGVHEAGAGIVGDVVAGEHRDREFVAAAKALEADATA